MNQLSHNYLQDELPPSLNPSHSHFFRHKQETPKEREIEKSLFLLRGMNNHHKCELTNGKARGERDEGGTAGELRWNPKHATQLRRCLKHL